MNACKQTFNEDVPKVWIGCLASYNNGILHGEWIEVPECPEEMMEIIDQILKTSPKNGEEWYIGDDQSFKPFKVSKYEGLKTLCEKSNVINRAIDEGNIEAFKHFDTCGLSDCPESQYEAFKQCYIGVHDRPEDYAEELLLECYDIKTHILYYIDFERLWEDMEQDGYYHSYDSCIGKYHIFNENY